MSTITNAIKRLGFFEGLRSYYRLRTGETVYKLEELIYPLTLRKGTADGRLFRQIFYDGEYDIGLDFEPRYIIDGGGNIGLFAVLFASRYPNATIISVEPDDSNFLLLRNNCEGYKNIKGVQSGIWNKDVFLKVVDEQHGEWGLMVTEVPDGTPGALRAVSIFGLMKKFNLPYLDIVKLDVETAEEAIFKTNYEEWLPKTRFIIIELHDYIKEGSSKPFWEAIKKYDFSHYAVGENHCLKNNSFKTPG